jgi:hypothetical protein
MIRYTLLCDHDHEFDGWFSSSAAFDEQAAAGDVACPHCASTSVRKALMAPSVAGTRKSRSSSSSPKDMAMMMSALRRHVLENFDNVGDRFAEIARRIHYEEEAPRAIYGQTTADEARELIEEGVEVMPLPGIDPKQAN